MLTSLEILEKFGQKLDAADGRFGKLDQQLADILAKVQTLPAPVKPADSPKLVAPQPLSLTTLVKMAQDSQVTDDAGKALSLDQLQRAVSMQMQQRGLAGAIAQVDGMAMGIPIGSGLAGGFIGLLADRGVDLFAPEKNVLPATGVNFMNVVGKGIAAWAVMQFGPQWIGRPASLFAAAFLALRVAQNVAPQVFEDLIDTILGFFNKGGTPAAFRNWPGVQSFQGQVSGHGGFPAWGGGIPANGQFNAHQVLPGFGGAGEDQLAHVFR